MVGCSADHGEPKDHRVVLTRQRISVPPYSPPAGDALARIGRSTGAKRCCRYCRRGILGRSFFEAGARSLDERMCH